jgi:hypothetical protein
MRKDSTSGNHLRLTTYTFLRSSAEQASFQIEWIPDKASSPRGRAWQLSNLLSSSPDWTEDEQNNNDGALAKKVQCPRGLQT